MPSSESRSRRIALPTAAALLLATGCTTSLTNLTPTRALDPGEVQVSVATQAQAGTGTIRRSLNAARAAKELIESESDEPIDEESLRDFVDGALVWLLFPPGAGLEVMGRVGVLNLLEGVEVGLRTDTKVLKADLKLQLLESEDGRLGLSALAGYGHHFSFVEKLVSYLTLTSFSRHDLDFQLSGGIEIGDYFRGYLNPRLMISSISTDARLPESIRARVPDSLEAYDPNRLFSDERLLYLGASMGVMAGYRHAFLALELNVLAMRFRPTVLGEERAFDSLVFCPAAAAVVSW